MKKCLFAILTADQNRADQAAIRAIELRRANPALQTCRPEC
jgi:hypothetical protein